MVVGRSASIRRVAAAAALVLSLGIASGAQAADRQAAAVVDGVSLGTLHPPQTVNVSCRRCGPISPVTLSREAWTVRRRPAVVQVDATTTPDDSKRRPDAARADSTAPSSPTASPAALAGRQPAPSIANPPASPLRVGVVADTQGWGPEVGQEQDRAARAGVRWLREEVQWSTIEPSDDAWSWDHDDRVVAEAARRGMRILPVLRDTPSWAGPASETLPQDPTEYAEFVAQVVARYGPAGTFWTAHPELDGSLAPEHFELWNEPYIAPFVAGELDPGRYARLVRAAATAGRAANPHAKFLLEADTTTYDPDGRPAAEWIDAMYAAVPDLGRYFDAVAVHPYGQDIDSCDAGFRWNFCRIDTIRARLAAHGDGAKPFWITEIGFHTTPVGGVSEGVQADRLRTLFRKLTSPAYRDWVQAVFVYHLRDTGPRDPANKESWFGLTRADGTPKPALDVLRTFATTLSV
jgi:hypothetical protein